MLLGAGGGHTECQPYLVQGAKLNEHDLARTFNVMATNIATIPRFLLPQLTWRASTFRPTSSVSRSLIRVSNGDCRQSQYRPISSQTTAWKTSQLRKIHTTTHISITSSTCLPYRSFYTSRPLYRDHHFDTLKFVQRLKDEGVSEDQAVAMMRVLSDVIEESIQNLTRTMVLREGYHPLSFPYPATLYPPPRKLTLPHYRRRTQHLHAKSRFHQTPFRAPLLRLDRNATDPRLARAPDQRPCETELAPARRDQPDAGECAAGFEPGEGPDQRGGQCAGAEDQGDGDEDRAGGGRVEGEGGGGQVLDVAVVDVSLHPLFLGDGFLNVILMLSDGRGVCTGTAALILGVWRLLM